MSNKLNETPKFDYVASYSVGGESTMELFHGLDHEGWVSDNFISEFKYLEQYSSSIKIYINSVGGSVVNGLNVFSTILNSKTPTTAVVTGIAASMASVIALAADTLVMNDYALLMWHMPYNPSGSSDDDQLDMFGKMLGKIYQERLNKTEEEIFSFMSGDEGKDGTWFDAETALDLGIISEIIPTGTQKSLMVDINDLEDRFDASEVANKLQDIAASINLSNNKNDSVKGTADEVVSKSVPENKNQKTMDLSKISASLGIEDANLEAVEARVSDIVAKNSALKQEIAKVNKSLLAKDESLTENGIELATAKAELKTAEEAKSTSEAKVSGLEETIATFEAEKAEAKKKEIEGIVDTAAEDGKISSDQKETWVALLVADFDGANSALGALNASGGGKVKLSNAVKPVEAKSEDKGEDTSYLLKVSDKMKELNKK